MKQEEGVEQEQSETTVVDPTDGSTRCDDF